MQKNMSVRSTKALRGPITEGIDGAAHNYASTAAVLGNQCGALVMVHARHQ